MDFEVIIPTRWELLKMENILRSINSQTIIPSRITFILDKEITSSELQENTYFLSRSLDEDLQGCLRFITHLNSDFIPYCGISYVRNFWIDNAKYDNLIFIDDDNEFESTFFERLINQRLTNKLRYKKDLLIAPLMVFRKTNIVQSQWFSFNFLLSKVQLSKDWNPLYYTPKMLSWNCIFWAKSIFQTYRFDEKMKFVYEDLDFTYRAFLWWVPLLVVKSIIINHMEIKKTKLRRLYIQDPMTAYQKAKNRIIFVKKNWSKIDNYKFFGLWLWLQTIWFILLIILHWEEKIDLLKAIYYWTKDWFKFNW